MCGIFGYVGERDAKSVLIHGLRRLEYRGYDSAGVAVLSPKGLHVRKCAGRLANLVQYLETHPLFGGTGIGHTRWATHGPATDVNAHPHVSSDGRVAVVHNGVIENHVELRTHLEARGIPFRSATDSEVIAQLIAYHFEGNLFQSVRKVLPLLKGTYGLAVVSTDHPDEVIAACLGSPLVIGVGKDEHFISSDPRALAGSSERVVYLQDGQVCVLSAAGCKIIDPENRNVLPSMHEIDGDYADNDKGEFDHFMLKEIYEQPEALEKTLRGLLGQDGHVSLDRALGDTERICRTDRLILTACGTSYHAALVGEYLIEELTRIPVEVEYASEFRYRNSPTHENPTVLAITQSGETADTLMALREAKRRGHLSLAICNVRGSTTAREADGTIFLRAGSEVSVASTKAFTCQMMALALLATYLGRQRRQANTPESEVLHDLLAIPDQMRRALLCHHDVRRVAERYAWANNFLFLGRQFLFPVALEGALKLKEISYVHAEGLPAGEMKHGPIALVDENTPSIFLMPTGDVREKVMSNLEEVKARGGPVIVIAPEGDHEAASRADEVVHVPALPRHLQPFTTVVPLQLLAYHIALLRSRDVDKPRNLAKSVTVE